MGIVIRRAEAADAPRLNAALRRLSSDLGDRHRAGDEDVRRAGFGAAPSFTALLAERDGEIMGVALASPVFSTTRGAPGAFVSDLWVSETARGTGLGRRLLSAVAVMAEADWGAAYLKLSVYHDNTGARAVYDRLGFAPLEDETTMILGASELDRLKGLK